MATKKQTFQATLVAAILMASSIGLAPADAAKKPTYASKMQLGQLLFFNGNIDGAINAFNYAAYLNPSAFEPHLNLVNLYVQKGGDEGIQKAIEECHKVLEIKPGNKEVHLILGNLLRTQASTEKDPKVVSEKMDEALKEIAKAQELGAPEAMCENTMGMVLMQQGKHNEALEHIEKALKKQPNFPDARLVRAVLLFKKLDTEGKIPRLENKQIDPEKGPEAVREVLEELDMSIKQKGKNAEAHHTKGEILTAVGKHEDALKSYSKATEDEPRYAQAWAGMANIHFQKKDYDKAKDAFKKARELNPNDKNIVYGLAVMLEKSGEIQAAIREFQEGLMLETDPMMRATIQMHIQQLAGQGGLSVPGIGGAIGVPGVGAGVFDNSALAKPFADLIKIKPPAGHHAKEADQ